MCIWDTVEIPLSGPVVVMHSDNWKFGEARIEKKPKRGKPQQTWDGAIMREIQRRGKNLKEAKELATNRAEWKKFIRS